MKNLFLLFALFFTLALVAQSEKGRILPKEIQIKTALLPVPEGSSTDTMVYGYSEDGDFLVLREGTSNLICLADDPNRDGISVSCYSKKLEPFMKRGRELRADGKDVMEIREIRGKEVSEGKLDMPREPSMMYVYYGADADYDSSTGELANGQFRYVIYIPYATTESTGLPDKPHAKGMPWLMNPAPIGPISW
ncbi:hypothetical protein NYZ99_13925 [Maribacter litopenaei]|uniref:Uncharacterized protein n=1 Tax=Maribacter litopenaei TaxID=2976127 RepID=A0ABY5Y6L8_9FLAO|nr:hypothetical protein [Maribacter litopenaei]UWX54120.1 hypothetical protein NYZ99_13925 [Maribacter litopenaei]